MEQRGAEILLGTVCAPPAGALTFVGLLSIVRTGSGQLFVSVLVVYYAWFLFLLLIFFLLAGLRGRQLARTITWLCVIGIGAIVGGFTCLFLFALLHGGGGVSVPLEVGVATAIGATSGASMGLVFRFLAGGSEVKRESAH